jgi:WD40-like Beta Propeller Repeat
MATVGFVAGACSPTPTLSLPPAQMLSLPSGELFNSDAWATPGAVVVGRAMLDQSRVGARLYSVTVLAGNNIEAATQPIDLPDDPSCPLILDTSPTRLTDGRLAEARYCIGPTGPAFTAHVFSLDGTFGPELGDLQRNNPTQISFNPDATRGVFGVSSLICAGIGFFGPVGVSPMPPMQIGRGGQAFRLSDTLAGSDCGQTGNADDPDWSPDGKAIAFLASSSAVGSSSRSDDPYDLDLAPAAELLAGNAQTSVRTILAGIASPTGMRWSPDGQWLVVAGYVSGHGPGTWLVRASDGRLKEVSAVELRTPSWSPDGTRIAGIDLLDSGGPRYQASLVLIDVSGVIGN